MTNDNEVTNSSFAVVISPEYDENNEWTGVVSAFLEEDVQKDLKEDEVAQLRMVTTLLASCLPLMEADTEFLDYIKEFYYNNFEEKLEELESLKDKPVFTRSEDGKVITLDFDTKTHGSA